MESASNNDHFRCGAGSLHIGCAANLDPAATPGGTGFIAEDGSNRLQSCASFGPSTAASATQWDTGNCFNNATNLASGLPGSSNQHSVSWTDATPFVEANNGASLDLRAVSATAMAGAGYRDSTNAPNDISGFARPSPPHIGHWEAASAAPQEDFPAIPFGLSSLQTLVRM